MKKTLLFILAAVLLILFVPPLIDTLRYSKMPYEDVVEDSQTVNTTDTADEDNSFEIVMHFAGDVLLAENLDAGRSGGFNEYAARESADYFLKNAAPYFTADDYTVVNLENVFSDSRLSPAQKTLPAYWFKSRTENTKILTVSGVECVSVANNHTGDYGEQGFKDTVNALEAVSIEYGTENKTVYFEKNGFRTAVICCCMWNRSWADRIIKRIKEAEEQSELQIVFFHGGKEAEHTPEQWKIEACRSLVDNGADIVIGGHPHVLQRAESYKDAKIIYSLGNFCFGGNRSPENRSVIYRLTVTVNPDDNSFTHKSAMIPFYVYTGNENNYQPDVIREPEAAQKVIEYMKGVGERPY